jgi:hypothetical protein
MAEINFVVLDNISSWEDEVFTFQPKNKEGEKIGDPLFFNATKLRALCDKTPNKYRIKAQINQEHYDRIIRSGAVERDRLNWLAENPLKLCEPIILCHYPEDDTQFSWTEIIGWLFCSTWGFGSFPPITFIRTFGRIS